MIDGDEQLLRRKAKLFRQQLPGEFNGTFLEVITKGEITEHLEECMVPRGIADIIEIIVLAARAHAFLAGSRAHVFAFLCTSENVFKRHHARVGEHERGVVMRHERAGGNGLMPVAGEKIEECGADGSGAAHRKARNKLNCAFNKVRNHMEACFRLRAQQFMRAIDSHCAPVFRHIEATENPQPVAG